MRVYLESIIQKALEEFSLGGEKVVVEHTADFSHGDYATNIALQCAPKAKLGTPHEFAEKLAEKLRNLKDDSIEKIEVAGPGFINFHLSRKFFSQNLLAILEKKDRYGGNSILAGEKVIIEYTDPNPFKEFHIGHLMPNVIGESLSRIIQYSGAETKRANYQGDVGLHVAKALWGLRASGSLDTSPENLGKAYARGAQAYEEDGDAKKEIEKINKAVYEKSDTELMALYDAGKQSSLDCFERMYKRLGTKFDFYFFESEVGDSGRDIVLKNLGAIFEKSDGAVIFPGEKFGLHSRVFVNSQGLPTYEAKELWLAFQKYERYPYTTSIVVTGNEIKEYFKVLLKALELINPDLARKTKHISHGMLRLPSGKMSSRTGNIITAESLIEEAKKRIQLKIEKTRDFDSDEREALAECAAIGAIKYSILKQSIGNDVIFDFDASLSFEGNSGPYLQYTYARARSVLRNASESSLYNGESLDASPLTTLERLLSRFPDVVERALREYAPHHIATYLIALAHEFNSFYAHERILDSGSEAKHRVLLTESVSVILRSGLHLLGISAPERM